MPPETVLQPSIPDSLPTRRRRQHQRRAALRWAKRVVLAVGALGVAGALAYAWMPRPVLVELGAVRRGTLRVEIEEDGRTRVRDRYVVYAPTAGTLRRVILHAGDPVVAGQPVARIGPLDATLLDERGRADAESRLEAAQARVQQAATAASRARAALALATRDAARARALAPDGVSQAELERAELTERSAREEVTASTLGETAAAAEARAVRAALDPRARGGASEVVVAAPIAGAVFRVLRDSDGPIAAGGPILEIGDPRAIEVVVDVLSADAARVAVGAPVTVEDWGGPPLPGHVRVVEPSGFTRVSALGVDEQRVNLIVALDDPPPALGDGFRVDARVEIWRGDGVLAVPASAAFRSGDGWAVFVADRGVARLHRVELGRRGRAEVEVTRGLVEGDAVIIYPGEKVADGVSVAARQQP